MNDEQIKLLFQKIENLSTRSENQQELFRQISLSIEKIERALYGEKSNEFVGIVERINSLEDFRDSMRKYGWMAAGGLVVGGNLFLEFIKLIFKGGI